MLTKKVLRKQLNTHILRLNLYIAHAYVENHYRNITIILIYNYLSYSVRVFIVYFYYCYYYIIIKTVIPPVIVIIT